MSLSSFYSLNKNILIKILENIYNVDALEIEQISQLFNNCKQKLLKEQEESRQILSSTYSIANLIIHSYSNTIVIGERDRYNIRGDYFEYDKPIILKIYIIQNTISIQNGKESHWLKNDESFFKWIRDFFQTYLAFELTDVDVKDVIEEIINIILKLMNSYKRLDKIEKLFISDKNNK